MTGEEVFKEIYDVMKLRKCSFMKAKQIYMDEMVNVGSAKEGDVIFLEETEIEKLSKRVAILEEDLLRRSLEKNV